MSESMSADARETRISFPFFRDGAFACAV